MSAPGKSLAIVDRLASRVGVDSSMLVTTLKATVLKSKDRPATDEEMVAFLAIAEKYGLDPWTKEIHAFVDNKTGAIVPIVSIDGWNHITNDHPEYDGEEIDMPPYDEWVKVDEAAKLAPPWMKIRIYRKDRSRPYEHIEYLEECYVPPRGGYRGPWQSHTKRMLEHKTRIQGRRGAFGFAGIYDEDEAQRIIAGEMPYEVEAAPEAIDSGEIIGPEDYQALLAEMTRTGLSEDSIRKNLEAKAHYTGALEDMPVSVYEALLTGLKSMPTREPENVPDPDDDGVPSDPPADMDEATDTASHEDNYWPTEDSESAPGPRSAAEAGRRAAAHAEEARAARPINQKQANLLFTKCTIHGVDERSELHEWLRQNLGVEHINMIPATRFDQVLAWVQGHEKGGKAA